MDNALFRQVDEYIQERFAKEDDVLKKVIDSLDESSMPLASISPNQGKFLQLLARLCNARRILEIGTLGGYSRIWLARTLTSDGRLITIELNEVNAAIAKKNIQLAGLDSIVDIKVGKAMDILNEMIIEDTVPFDLIFIDADKPPYVEYFEAALKLSRSGTIIIADNVIRLGKILDTESVDPAVIGVQRFNDMLAASDQADATILPSLGLKDFDGMAIAVVR